MQPVYAIKLDHPDFAAYVKESHPSSSLGALEHLGRVNLFVGANNSGKSRMLRRLACLPVYDVKFDSETLFRVGQEIRQLVQTGLTLHAGRDRPRGLSSKDLEAQAKSFPDWLRLGQDTYAPYRETFSKFLSDENRKVQKAGEEGSAVLVKIPERLDVPDRHYIPVLRGLRPLRQGDANPHASITDYYLVRTQADYFKEEKSPPALFTGTTLYHEVRKLLLGYHRDRQRVAAFQQFLSSVFFEGHDVILVPKHDDDVLHVKIGHEADRPIYSLGDGIQQAIILSFLPFTAAKPSFFFIEEPELHMHPGMQRKLLDFFVAHERCQQHHFFITTHSNHLLDLTADYETVSVISFRKRLKKEATADGDKEPEFVVQPMDAGDESVLLDLGVRKSSVFLVNATIWVEGITDRLYLRRFLELYQAASDDEPGFYRVQEDIHYAFLEYGGGNVTHFFIDAEGKPSNTLHRVCGKVFLLIDEDGLGKQERKAKLQQAVGGCFAMTPGREIENLLPIEVIHAVVSDYEKKYGGSPPPVPTAPHRDAKLGNYIHEVLFKGNGCKRPGGYRAESGTIKSGRAKVEFCKRAIEKLTKFEELSSEVQELVGRIHEFVVKQNS